MILEDRKQEIFLNKGNINICQDNCEFVNYDSSMQKAKCECSPQIGEIDMSSSFSDIVVLIYINFFISILFFYL